MLFCAPQVLMITPTLCTQRTTVICWVQTTSKSSPTGPHINKHWCRSCGANSSPTYSLCVSHMLISFTFRLSLLNFSWFPPAVCLLSWPLKKGNRRGGADGEYCSVSQSGGHPLCWACWGEDPVPSQALPQSSSLGFTMVQCLKLTDTTPSTNHSSQRKQISFRFSAGSLIAPLFLWVLLDV